MKKPLSVLLALLALLASLSAGPAHAAGESIPWDKFPRERLTDMAALQNGAKLFVNYCLNCHSAAYVRYNRLADIGLTEEQIRRNLMFASEKVGETMKTSLDPKQAKEWFGGLPPDLSVIARSRAGFGQGANSGSDYLYTFLRSYYRDDTKATGWNNRAFPNVGMPHPLWELQGQRRAVYVDVKDPHDPTKTLHQFKDYEQITPGTLNEVDYNNAIADLVAFLTWMSEPAQQSRQRLGVWVLLFLSVFTLIAWRLNAAYWKDVK